MIDSHAHLDSLRYDGELDPILERAWTGGVRAIVAIGIGEGPDTMHLSLEIVRKYAGRADRPRLFATAGIHPHEARLADEQAFLKLEQLLRNPEIIAAGEIGLDYFYDHSPREQQLRVLLRQVEIAAALKRPIVIHCRPSKDSANAWDQVLEMIEAQWASTGLGGILHCFTGEWDHARRAMDAGFLVSFAGNITFAKSEGIRGVARRLPLDQMLIETDAPFLAPVPHRGQRNEPAWVVEVAKTVAEIRKIDVAEVAQATANNFRRLFPAAREM